MVGPLISRIQQIFDPLGFSSNVLLRQFAGHRRACFAGAIRHARPMGTPRKLANFLSQRV